MLYTIYSSLNQLQIRLLIKLVDLFILVLDSLCALCETVQAQCLTFLWACLRQTSPPLKPAHPQAQPDFFLKGTSAALLSRISEERMCHLTGSHSDQLDNLQ